MHYRKSWNSWLLYRLYWHNQKNKKILGIHFSYKRKLETEENFIRRSENRLKYWSIWSTEILENAKSKIIHLSLITNVVTEIINELNKIQKEFIRNGNNQKFTLCNKYENGSLKNLNVLSKVISLQSCWIKRLYDNSPHLWKITPSYLIDTYLGKKV